MSGRRQPLATLLPVDGFASAQLRELGDDRLTEAKLLLDQEFFAGAAYIVGYAVELHIRAIIADRRFAGFWPPRVVAQEVYHHDLDVLLTEAGLQSAIRQEKRHNRDLGINWQTIRMAWEPSLRYQRVRRRLARNLVEAVGDQRSGVVPWLKNR